ncbi:MAG: hypothetical protein ABSF87_15965 [Xanthobacteraceae bacterium]|jgi:hypothetical protein
MVVSKEWVNEHQKVVAVAKDTEENWQKRPGDLLMENKHLLLDEALKNNPKLTMTDVLITDQEIAILCDVLALQLHFCFEMGAACFGLVSSSPE